MLFESCVLLKYSQQEGSHVLECHPIDKSFIQHKKPFLSCAFPESQYFDSIYSFSIKSYLCFTWTFIYSNILYSIVIITHHNFASLYLNFLRNAKRQLDLDAPFERYHCIIDEISRWELNYKTNILTFYSFGTKGIRLLNESDAYYLNFDPSIYFGSLYKMKQIWNSLLTNRGVLIVGNSAESVSSAVFAAMSIIAPLKYTEKYIIYTKLGDNRFSDMIIGSLEYKLVGTTNVLAKDRCKQYETIVELPSILYSPRPKLRNVVNRMTSYLLKNFEARLDKKLKYDPFFDFLEKDLDDNDIRKISEATKMMPKEIKDFQKTVIFKNWRKSIRTRIEFRECFLSNGNDFNFQMMKIDEIIQIRKVLSELIKFYSYDFHMKSVISRQINLLNQIYNHID